MYSGRGAAKSWSIAQALMALGVADNLRILCTREFQTSINHSVHGLLSDINAKFNLGYQIQNNSIIHPLSGTEFSFHGLARNIDNLKSFEGADIVWIEEASSISQQSLDKLIPTIRKKDSEIWISFNPDSETDAVYKMFVTPYGKDLQPNKIYIDQQHYIINTSYKDNPFITETMLADIESLKKTNYKKYQHVYGGHIASSSQNCIIQPLWFDAVIDAHKKLNIKIKGEKVVGFDPADGGHDSKAAVYRTGILVEDLQKWTDGDLEEAVERVFNDATTKGTQHIIYDGIGLGVGAKMKFKSYDPKETIQRSIFIGSATPIRPLSMYKESMTNKEMFRNARAQGYWLLADRFEATYRAVVHNEYINTDDLISISSDCPNISELKEELTQIRRKKSSSSAKIQIESKQDMKSRQLDSPGLADSMMYAFSQFDEAISTKAKAPLINYSNQW